MTHIYVMDSMFMTAKYFVDQSPRLTNFQRQTLMNSWQPNRSDSLTRPRSGKTGYGIPARPYPVITANRTLSRVLLASASGPFC